MMTNKCYKTEVGNLGSIAKYYSLVTFLAVITIYTQTKIFVLYV